MAENLKSTEVDEDSGKGVVESEAPGEPSQVSYTGQIGHRDEDPMLKDNDTDFPEPDAEEEHTGEPAA